jgi:hypothetical protein
MQGMCDSTALRTARHLAALLFVVVLTASAAGKAGAGPWPNLLDDNRSGAYTVAAQAVVNLLAPFACHMPSCKVQAGGRVVASPKIVNLFWDNNWDAHNPGSLTRAQINAAVQTVAGSEYLDAANQYGVHRGSFHSAHASSTLCQTMRPTAPGGTFASDAHPGTMGLTPLLGWVTCEIEGAVVTGVPLPDNNTIYSIFLPEGITITGQPGATCGPVYAFHMTTAVVLPNTDADVLLGVAFKIVAIPIIVMPAECMLDPHSTTAVTQTTKDMYTKLFSHELVEASLDPIAPTGWIDNRWAPDISAWTSKGEPGDICQASLAYAHVVTSPPGLPSGIETSPVPLRSNGAMVLPYWSNKDKRCVPIDTTKPSSATTTTTTATTTTTPVTTTARTKPVTKLPAKTTPTKAPPAPKPPAATPPLAGAWSHLGIGATAAAASLNGAVYALNADAPGVLLAGGTFTTAGGKPAAHIARWNGTSWSSLGSTPLNGDVHAIAYHAGKVYVGGVFTNAGGDANLDFLAEWNGTKWVSPCNATGPAVTANVNALQIIGSTLYIGGAFANGAGIASADFLLACDLNTGAASSTVLKDGDFPGGVYALAADSNGTLYAGGGFSNLMGIPQADNIAAYSGGSWHALGSGGGPGGGPVDGYVRSLTAHGTDLYVGTDAKDVAGIAQADHIARWNGSAWSAVGSSANGHDGWFPATAFIYAMATVGPQVFAAGSFQNAGGDPRADQIAYFDGATWHALGSNGSGNGPWIGNGLALAIFRQRVIAGGNFTSAGSDVKASYVASSPLH